MAVYFISDVHLGHDSEAKEREKLRKLEGFFRMVASNGEHLYILGDLFDFWFEYKHAIPKDHLKVLFLLSQLVESGVKLSYITGNHDFWLGDMLTRHLDIEVFRDATTVTHEGKNIYLIHGDGLAKADRGYRILKRIMRNRVNIFLYRQIPPDIGIPFAKWCSRTSRKHSSGVPKSSFVQEYRDFAEHKLREGYDCVMIGHTHHPERIEFESGVYINTGDWCENFTYAVLTNGRFELKFWGTP
ncbi:MAG: UDP-2,3-diacylglucosamine diphosphatase [Candidatus Zixiibacteriota bacterium]